MAIDQPLLINWGIPLLMSVRMRISLVSWIASTETDPRVGGVSPLGTFPWYCTSWQRLLLNWTRLPWSTRPSRLSSCWPCFQVNAGVRSMLGYIRTSDTGQTGPRCLLIPHPVFFLRTSSWPWVNPGLRLVVLFMSLFKSLVTYPPPSGSYSAIVH